MEIEENSVDEVKINYRGIKAMPFVIGNKTFEKLGTTGTISNFLVYLTTVFGMKNITAANVVNIFNGTTNFATLIGAFLCDTYFGRYKTSVFFHSFCNGDGGTNTNGCNLRVAPSTLQCRRY